MIKSKYLILIVVMTVIMLLVFGNWVTSAQATSTGIVDTTPTPIGTPDPDVPAGVIPSAEEQEELKTVVQSYVEIRYRALSVADAEDFKQNGFGSLISEIPEAEASLSEEMAKLAVEIKRADLNQLRYVDYKYSLDFRSITINPSTQTATILMTEGNEVIYEISAELNPENPIVSYSAGIEHTIILHKIQDQWKIISDTYNDDLWKMLRPTEMLQQMGKSTVILQQAGKSTDEILSAAEELIRILEAEPKSSALRTSNVEAAPAYLSDDPSSHPYDRAGAVEYALEHWNSSPTNKYNPDYFSFLNDCQNFVSQALYEGGNVTMFIPDPENISGGNAGWYYLGYDIGLSDNAQTNKVSTAWNYVEQFYNVSTLPNEAWSEYWNQGPEGTLLAQIPGTAPDQVPAGLMLGDVIQTEKLDNLPGDPDTNGPDFDHSAIVVSIENGIPYI